MDNPSHPLESTDRSHPRYYIGGGIILDVNAAMFNATTHGPSMIASVNCSLNHDLRF
jgi:hypothetical protein